MGEFRRAAADLFLGARCAGCDAPGWLVCDRCAALVRPTPRVCWPDPTPPELLRPVAVTPVASGDYDGVLRALLLELKEHGRYPLLPVLAELLAASVLTAVASTDREGAALRLVPMPSRRSAVRVRGYDAVRLLAAGAGARLRRQGCDIRMTPALRHRGRVRDQAGLGAIERRQNLAGSLALRGRLRPDRMVVVVDDVITTGSSMAEAVRVLDEAGVRPVAAAAVAATRRLHPVQPRLSRETPAR